MTNLTRRIPFSLFEPMSDLETLPTPFRRWFNEGLAMPPFNAKAGWMPAVDVLETDEELMLTAELPGMAKADIEITVVGDVLTMRGEKVGEKEDEKKKFHMFERFYGTFQRSFTLPRSVDPEKATADFDKGVLRIHLPKTPKAKGKLVEIK
jgi:HSP20 family protein